MRAVTICRKCGKLCPAHLAEEEGLRVWRCTDCGEAQEVHGRAGVKVSVKCSRGECVVYVAHNDSLYNVLEQAVLRFGYSGDGTYRLAREGESRTLPLCERATGFDGVRLVMTDEEAGD